MKVQSCFQINYSVAMGVQQHFYVRNPSNIVGPNDSLTSQMFNEEVQKRLLLYTRQLSKAVEGLLNFNTIGHRSINGLCCYEGNQTNIYIFFSG